MNFFRRIFRKKYPIVLGRWNLNYDEEKISRIVHLANEDHCGCCFEEKPKHLILSNINNNMKYEKLKIKK